jgi:hypothetical protein
VQWVLTEVADECGHSVMFARTAETFGAPSYQPPASTLRLGKAFVQRFDGPAAYAAILVAEEILDIVQRDVMKDERVQPLTRATGQIHVVQPQVYASAGLDPRTRRSRPGPTSTTRRSCAARPRAWSHSCAGWASSAGRRSCSGSAPA